MRKAGLEREGEYSVENLTYKVLRRIGYLDKLRDLGIEAYDVSMSLEEKYLFERKRTPSAKPEIMYHGTSSKFLKSILNKGIQAEPKNKRWEDDPGVTHYTSSRVSLLGSYWTTNIMTAISSAGNTQDKFGGNRIIVIAQIVAKTAFADEDDVRTKINYAMTKAIGDELGSISVDQYPFVFGAFESDSSMKNQIIDNFSNELHKRLQTNEKQPINKNLLKQVFDTAFTRSIAHSFKNDEYWALKRFADGFKRFAKDYEKAGEEIEEKYYSGGSSVPFEWKNVQKAEKDFLDAQEKLTRYYPKTALDKDEFNRTLRMPKDIGFEGRSKIIGIVEFIDPNNLKIIYGEVPTQFKDDYSKSWGPNFKIQ